ncbi:MAG: hypothetical protein ChlgKO_02660 [Chlamydiales bacterium]
MINIENFRSQISNWFFPASNPVLEINEQNLCALEATLNTGFNPDTILPNGRTLLTQVFYRIREPLVRVEFLKIILNKSANPNIPDQYGQYPLLLEVQECKANTNFDCISILVENGADVNIENGRALAITVRSSFWRGDTTMYLLSAGADPNIQNLGVMTPFSWTALWYQLAGEQAEEQAGGAYTNILNAMLEVGANIHQPCDNTGKTLLTIADQRNDLSLVKKIISLDTDGTAKQNTINYFNNYGIVPNFPDYFITRSKSAIDQ